MKKFIKSRNIILIILTIFLMIPAFSQEGEKPFRFNIGIGADVISEKDQRTEDNPTGATTYNFIAFDPEISVGKFAFGMNLKIRYTINDEGSPEVRDDDWTPKDDVDFIELYLPKISYIKYGEKSDPLYIKGGSINNASLGNGFIMGNYSNMLFLPEKRIFGLDFGLDGLLFDFPYAGMQFFAGNVVNMDVFATRIFVRPLAGQEIPILKNLEIGGTAAGDNDIYAHIDDEVKEDYQDPDSISIVGVDFRLPILAKELFTFAFYGDYVAQDSTNGEMLGIGGRLLKFFPYNAQIRFLGKNFQPTYFDNSYDVFRVQKYQILKGEAIIEDAIVQDTKESKSWLVSTGFSFLQDKLAFNASLEGPFDKPAKLSDGTTDKENFLNYPELKAGFVIAEGVIPNFFFDAFYDKKFIKEAEDIFDPENSVIGTRFNYRSGTAIISLVYNLTYDPNAEEGEDQWKVTSGIQTSISF